MKGLCRGAISIGAWREDQGREMGSRQASIRLCRCAVCMVWGLGINQQNNHPERLLACIPLAPAHRPDNIQPRPHCPQLTCLGRWCWRGQPRRCSRCERSSGQASSAGQQGEGRSRQAMSGSGSVSQ